MNFATVFFAVIPLVYAIPALERDLSALSSRAQGAVFVCVDSFTGPGPCAKFSGASGQCVNFPAAFNDNISAVGPDSGQDCFFFLDGGCTGASFGPIRNPGVANIPTDPRTPGFNDQLSSFKCFFG